jgi:hypothetical protein
MVKKTVFIKHPFYKAIFPENFSSQYYVNLPVIYLLQGCIKVETRSFPDGYFHFVSQGLYNTFAAPK